MSCKKTNEQKNGTRERLKLSRTTLGCVCVLTANCERKSHSYYTIFSVFVGLRTNLNFASLLGSRTTNRKYETRGEEKTRTREREREKKYTLRVSGIELLNKFALGKKTVSEQPSQCLTFSHRLRAKTHALSLSAQARARREGQGVGRSQRPSVATARRTLCTLYCTHGECSKLMPDLRRRRESTHTLSTETLPSPGRPRSLHTHTVSSALGLLSLPS